MTKHTVQNVNIVGDCLILLVASAVATKAPGVPGAWHWMVLPGMAMGAMLVWTLGGRLLRHYDVWNGRGIAGDVALTAILLGVMLAVMATLHVMVPRYAAGSDLSRFNVVAVP